MKVYLKLSCFLLVFFLLFTPFNATASEINSDAAPVGINIDLSEANPADSLVSETIGAAVYIEEEIYNNEYATIYHNNKKQRRKIK